MSARLQAAPEFGATLYSANPKQLADSLDRNTGQAPGSNPAAGSVPGTAPGANSRFSFHDIIEDLVLFERLEALR